MSAEDGRALPRVRKACSETRPRRLPRAPAGVLVCRRLAQLELRPAGGSTHGSPGLLLLMAQRTSHPVSASQLFCSTWSEEGAGKMNKV